MSSTPVERIILFDGVCNLCNGLVQFVIRRDPHAKFKFAPLEGVVSRSDPVRDSIILVENGSVFDRSSAVLRVARQLRPPWPLLFAFIIVPRPVRDWAYDVVARHRYRWFGRRETCMVPTPELRARFLEGPAAIGYASERGR